MRKEATPVVDIRHQFNSEQRQICNTCRIESGGVCKLAELQKRLRRKPFTYDAVKEGLDFSKIPENCPNGYKQPDPQPFS